MRSIPAAVTWEFLVHGKWAMALGLAGSMAIPMLLGTLMREIAPAHSKSPEMVFIYLTISMIAIFNTGVCIVASREPIRRWCCLPISNTQIVFWQMLTAILAMAVLFPIYASITRWVFQIDFPVLAPTLFAMTCVAGLQVAAWQQVHPIWAAGYWIVAVSIFSNWFAWLHGNPLFLTFRHSSPAWHMWREVTGVELLAMLLTIGVSGWLGVRTVASVRRGDSPKLLEWMRELINLVWSKFGHRRLQFDSPRTALCWCEQREKGLILPIATLLVTTVGLVLWCIDDPSAEGLFNGLKVGGGFLIEFSLVVGATFGLQFFGKNYELSSILGHFLSARPVSNAEYAWVKIRSLAKSLTIGWFIWLTVFILSICVTWCCGSLPQHALPEFLGWCFLPAVWVGCWTVSANCMTIVLSGRAMRFLIVALVAWSVYIAVEILNHSHLLPISMEAIRQSVSVVIGSGCIVATFIFFYLALRNSMISVGFTAISFAAWLVSNASLAFYGAGWFGSSIQFYALAIGVVSLIFLPLAAAPLAVQWNRVR